ncbi:MAG: cation:proton antiporter, partial [Methanoregulaceae archaeon]
SIALAVLYGSPVIATTIAAMVIVTSIIGSFTAKYSTWLRRGIVNRSRKKALMYHPHSGK